MTETSPHFSPVDLNALSVVVWSPPRVKMRGVLDTLEFAAGRLEMTFTLNHIVSDFSLILRLVVAMRVQHHNPNQAEICVPYAPYPAASTQSSYQTTTAQHPPHPQL